MAGLPVAVMVLLAGGACAAPATRVADAPDRPPQTRSVEQRPQGESTGLPEPGHGTLRQDQFTIELQSDALLLKVTPLQEEVIRLAAPDTYTRLHALVESRRAQAQQRTMREDPAFFLVSVFSYEPNVTYQPDDVRITHQGRLLRPALILPLTPGWGRQQLAQQESQSALYVYDRPIDLQQPLTVQYEFRRSEAWHQTIIPRLDEERGKVRARIGGW